MRRGGGRESPIFFLFGTICPKVKALGPQIMRCAPGFGDAPQQAFFVAPRAAKIASVATLALLAVSVLPYNPYEFDGTCPPFLR